MSSKSQHHAAAAPLEDSGMLSRLLHSRRDTDAWQLVPDLGNLPGDTYITEKNTYDAFQNTRLESLLLEWGVDLLVIGGVATNMCCETTARCVRRHRVQPTSAVALRPASQQRSDSDRRSASQPCGVWDDGALLCRSMVLSVCVGPPSRRILM